MHSVRRVSPRPGWEAHAFHSRFSALASSYYGSGASELEALVWNRGHVASLLVGVLLSASGLVVAACGVIGVVYTEL